MKVKDFKFAIMAFVVMMTGLSFTSCSKDDPDEPTPANELIGTWEWSDEEEEGDESVKYLMRYTFNEDLTGVYYEKITYVTSKGSKDENMSMEESERFTYIYDEDDDELILNFKEEDSCREYDIKGLSAKELMLKDNSKNMCYFEKIISYESIC